MRSGIHKTLWYKAITVVAVLTMTGCQHIPSSSRSSSADLWRDDVFQAETKTPESQEEIFALSEQTKKAVRDQVLVFPDPKQRNIALLNFIFNQDRDILSYVNDATLTASQTLERRQANCLSLTILAYSLADSLGFKAQFQDVDVPEYWVTQFGNSMLNGHVNLLIEPESRINDWQMAFSRNATLVDFDRASIRNQFKTTPISKQTIVALFYNNKAAEALLAERYDEAYAYLKAALKIAPTQVAVWNNLAILYRQKALLSEAERVYQHSLTLDPHNNNTKANLAALYRLTGRVPLAMELEEVVLQKRLVNPYYHLMLANEAMARQETLEALESFRVSLRLQPAIPEVLEGMAVAYARLGHVQLATDFLKQARKHAAPGSERRRFQAKIDFLQAQIHSG